MTTPSPHFDNTHPVYLEALQTLTEIAMSDELTTEERERAQERTFGMCVGIATMLIPGVAQTRQTPPIELADEVCAQVVADMEALIRKEVTE